MKSGMDEAGGMQSLYLSPGKLMEKKKKKEEDIKSDWSVTLGKVYKLMSTAKAMTDLFEANFKEVAKYVHAPVGTRRIILTGHFPLER